MITLPQPHHLALALLLATSTIASAEPTSWTGFYAGINTGYNFANNDNAKVATNNIQACTVAEGCLANPAFRNASAASAATSQTMNDDSSIFGGEIGYTRQFRDRWLAGLVTDLHGMIDSDDTANKNVSGVNTSAFGSYLTSNTSISQSIDYLGTLRGRIGYLLKPTVLLSVTGGLAYGKVRSATSINQSISGPPDPGIATSWNSSGSYSATRAGWTAGANIEWLFTTNWSLKGEYLYADLGTVTYRNSNLAVPTTLPGFPIPNYFVTGTSTTSAFKNQLIQVVFDYHFA